VSSLLFRSQYPLALGGDETEFRSSNTKANHILKNNKKKLETSITFPVRMKRNELR
jgi:hypothetical protein